MITTQTLINALPFVILTIAGICITYGGAIGIIKAVMG
jgi:hypothetical protein